MSEDFEELTEEVIDAQDTLCEPLYEGAPRFAVKRHISSGGLATVFLVQDRQRNSRNLAAKISHHPESEENVFDFFQRETTLLNQIHSPEENTNVVMLYDSLVCSGFPVLFMEYMPKTLTSYIKRLQKNKVNPDEDLVLRFLENTCNGVKAIHAHDWTHRDIKPSNILLSSDETRVKVADLGSVGHRGTKSSAMSVLIWRAPEVFPDTEKEEHYWSFQSDIYSLSVLGVALLSGKSKPFADDQNTASSQKNDPKYLSNLVKNLPASKAFKDTLLQNLNRDPEKRCSSIDEFVARLKGQGAVEINTKKSAVYSAPAALNEVVSAAEPAQSEEIVVDVRAAASKDMLEKAYVQLEQAVHGAERVPQYGVRSKEGIRQILEKRTAMYRIADEIDKVVFGKEHKAFLDKADDLVLQASEKDIALVKDYCNIIKSMHLTPKDRKNLKKRGWDENKSVDVFADVLNAWKPFRKPPDKGELYNLD